MTISRKQFIDNALAHTAGKYTVDVGKVMGSEGEDPMKGGVQTASLGSSVAGMLRGLLNKDTRNILHNSRIPVEAERELADEAKVLLDQYAERKVAPGPAEADRMMKNLDTTEDFAKLLEIMGQKYSPDTHTWAQVEKETSTLGKIEKELEPVLKGIQPGTLTDTQMFGLRRMLVTVGEEATAIANKIVEGDRTPETLALYQQKFHQLEALYNFSRKNAAQIARALNQQKMLAKAVESRSVQDLINASQSMGSPEAVAAHAQIFLNKRSKGLGKAVEYVAEKANSGTKALLEYWKNNILSGIETHMLNVSSTALVNVWENLIVRPTAAGVGAIRSRITGNQDRVTFAEGIGTLAGSWVGLRSGIKLMANTLRTGESKFGLSKDEATGELHRILGEKLGDAATLSFRLLRAEDELTKSVAFTQQIYSLAVREGVKQGLEGNKLNKFVADFVDDPPVAAYDEAMEYAKHLTFTQDQPGGIVGTLAQSARSLVGKYPVFGFVVPFINTPSNLMNYALESSFLAPIAPSVIEGFKKGGAAADIATAKVITGMSLSAAAYQLYLQGILTGDGPPDYKQRQFLEQATGWKQQGVKIGDTWYSLDRADPFAQSLALVTNYFDKATYAKDPKAAEQYMARAMFTLAEVAMDSTWLNNFSEFLDVASGDKPARSFVGNIVTGFVPYSGLVASVEKGVDPVKRKADYDNLSSLLGSYLKNRTAARIPGLSEYVRPARAWDGSVIVPPGGLLAHMVSPIKSSPNKEPGPVEKEFISNGVTPTEPDSVITVGPIQISLLSLDNGQGMFYDAYIKRVGQIRKAILKEVVGREDYKSLETGPGSQRSVILERALAAANQAATGLFITEDILPVLEQYPQLRNKMAEQIGQDPISFFQDMADKGLTGADLPLDVIIRGRPIRSPIPVPGEGPTVTKEQLMPRF